jgi:hypothetical protein
MSQPPGGPPPKKSSTNVWLWVVLGLIGTCGVCGVFGAAILVPAFSQARLAARSTVDLSNAKQVALSVLMYNADYDERMPTFVTPEQITHKLEPYIKSSSLRNVARSYTWNAFLSGKSVKGLQQKADIWVFQSSFPDPGKRFEIGYLDGHAKRVKPEELAALKMLSQEVLTSQTK